MILRYLKYQLIVLVCGGIVGPIFIAVGYAVGDVVSSLFYIGIVITVLDVVIAIGLAVFSSRSAAKSQMLEAQGVLAFARVVGVTETGTEINHRPLVKLSLQIEAPGLTPFTAQDSVIASMDRLPMITARQLVALVDPATNAFQIDWNRSALVSGVAPAQFTLSEDNRTYDLTGQVGPLMEIMHILKANGVPMDGAIDIRSNPAVRQQVMAVVRRAASQQAPPPPAPAPVPVAVPEPSASQRLQELKTLRATGAISDDEYAAKRQQIIADL